MCAGSTTWACGVAVILASLVSSRDTVRHERDVRQRQIELSVGTSVVQIAIFRLARQGSQPQHRDKNPQGNGKPSCRRGCIAHDAKALVWELIQNAKDVNIEGTVRVRSEADLDGPDAHVTFKHNGSAFSPENIRFLIELVSSKDRTNDSNGRPTPTGRFGTGFLTTHLLSERDLVKGVAEGRGFAPKKFRLSLDRSGSELQDIIDAILHRKVSRLVISGFVT
jgi:hypothetical protein